MKSEELKKKHGDERREEILRVIVEYIQKHGYSPTVREICDAIHLSSTSTVHAHIQKMIESGMLETDAEETSARAIRVPGYKFVKEKK